MRVSLEDIFITRQRMSSEQRQDRYLTRFLVHNEYCGPSEDHLAHLSCKKLTGTADLFGSIGWKCMRVRRPAHPCCSRPAGAAQPWLSEATSKLIIASYKPLGSNQQMLDFDIRPLYLLIVSSVLCMCIGPVSAHSDVCYGPQNNNGSLALTKVPVSPSLLSVPALLYLMYHLPPPQ